MELEDKLQLYSKSIEDYIINEETKLKPKEIIDALGGEKKIKDKFDDADDAFKFISDNIEDLLDTFDLEKDDFPAKDVKLYLRKLFK